MARTYLVVIDDSPESRVALRFAARRAAKTDGRVDVLAVVEPQEFVQWGGVQAAIEEEQRLRIEGIVAASIGEIMDAAGITPDIIIRQGDPVAAVRAHIGTREDVDALHDLLRGIDATILDAPADYPRYGPTYYAVFFADPDGLKREFVFGATGA